MFEGEDKMRIGILGSGRVGKGLGAWLAKKGFPVLFGSRTPLHASEAARAAGYGAGTADLHGLVHDSQAILLTLPFGEVPGALESVRASLPGKILVDVTNPISPDHRGLTIGHTDSGAERIARQFPEANVVKAFNAVFAEIYLSQKPTIGGRPISIFFAGDNLAAKSEIRHIIAKLEFDPVDAGPLTNARYLEPLSLLNIHLGRVLGFGTTIGFSLLRAQ